MLEIISKFTKLSQVAQQILNHQTRIKTYVFLGEVGSGKTTLIKYICQNLSKSLLVQSPTFSLMNIYPLGDKIKVYHIDLYRLAEKWKTFLYEYQELFTKNDYCFIESTREWLFSEVLEEYIQVNIYPHEQLEKRYVYIKEVINTRSLIG